MLFFFFFFFFTLLHRQLSMNMASLRDFLRVASHFLEPNTVRESPPVCVPHLNCCKQRFCLWPFSDFLSLERNVPWQVFLHLQPLVGIFSAVSSHTPVWSTVWQLSHLFYSLSFRCLLVSPKMAFSAYFSFLFLWFYRYEILIFTLLYSNRIGLLDIQFISSLSWYPFSLSDYAHFHLFG